MKQSEYYCFISYKHYKENDGKQPQFKDDAEWADKIARTLERMPIPTDRKSGEKIYDSEYIRDIDRHRINPEDERIQPVFREGTCVGTGELGKRLDSALKASRSLAVIISDEMIKDQDQRFEENDSARPAHCYDEIAHYIKYHKDAAIDSKTFLEENVFLLYIENHSIKEVKSVLPIPIIKALLGEEKDRNNLNEAEVECLNKFKVICLFDEVHDKSEITSKGKDKVWKKSKTDMIEWGAAKIAAGIFDTDVHDFLTFFKQEKAEQKRRRCYVIILFTVLCVISFGVVSYFYYEKQIMGAFRYLAEAKAALNYNNDYDAYRLSLKAKRSKALPEIKELQLRLLGMTYTKSIQIDRQKSLIVSPNNDLWLIEMIKNKLSLSNKDISGERAMFRDLGFNIDVTFSPNCNRFALCGDDSIWVYNTSKSCIDLSIAYNSSRPQNSGEIRFSPKGDYMIRFFRPDSLVVHDFKHNNEIIMHEQVDDIISTKTDLFVVSHTKDSVFVKKRYFNTKRSDNVLSLPLMSDYGTVYYNPDYNYLVTSSSDSFSYYSPTIRCVHYNACGLFKFDLNSNKYVTVESDPDKGTLLTIWREGEVLGKHSVQSTIRDVAFGKDGDMVFCNDSSVYVWSPNRDQTFKMNVADDRLINKDGKKRIIIDGEYLRFVNFGLERSGDYYATFIYPDFAMLQDRDEKLVEQDAPSSNNGNKSSVRFEEYHRSVVFDKHSYCVYSLDDDSLIKSAEYPFEDSINVTVSEELGNGLICTEFSHMEESETSLPKGHSWLAIIDVLNGNMVKCVARDYLFFMSVDDKNIATSSLDGKIQFLDHDLNLLSNMHVDDLLSSEPNLADNGCYYIRSGYGELYKCSFDKNLIKKEPLPYFVKSYSLINKRYVLLNTSSVYTTSSYLYDLISSQIVLYLLPEENIISICDDKVRVRYKSDDSDVTLMYERPLLPDEDIPAVLEARFHGV